MIEMEIKKWSELVSLFLTVPTVILAVVVVAFWGSDAWAAARKKTVRDATDWLLMGVAIGFIGNALDNMYWTVPWAYHFSGSPKAMGWIEWGPAVNVFVRQLCGIMAGYCHVRSALQYGLQKREAVNIIFFVSLVMGVGFAITLYLM